MQKLSNRFLKRPKHSIAGFDTGVYSASEIYGDETQIEASSIRAKKHMMQGNLHFNHGEYDEAIMCYTKAIQEQSKDSVQAFYNRGMTYYEMGDWSNAFQDLSTVIANDPKSHKGYERRAKILYAQGELTAAISDYTSAIQLEPTRINYYLNRAYIYWKLGQYTEAKQDYTNAIEINPHDSFAFLGRGETNYELGQFEAAYNDFEKAHALKPQLNSIEAELAIVHYTLGRVDKGRTIWEQLVNNNKNYENLNWISEEFGWGPTLIQKAQELIDSL